MPVREQRPLDVRVEQLLAQVPWAHTSGFYRALDLRFRVRTCDPALGTYLESLLVPFEVDESSDGPVEEVVWFSGLERGPVHERRFVTYVGRRRIAATPRRSLALASLLWAFNREVVARAEGCLLLHAAAAERDGIVVLLPASQNSGKTTLCAGLLRRGYRYVTDEAVAVDTVTGCVRPFPKALSLDSGSWPLFPDQEPRLGQAQSSYVRDQWHVPAVSLGAEVAGSRVGMPRVLLSPRHAAGAEGMVSPLRPAEAVLLLHENSFNGSTWGQDGLSAAARLVQGCAVVGRLSVGDLEEACDVVDRAVELALAVPSPEEPPS